MIITAHSGCDGTPDNSIESIHHALTTAADALEIDVHLRPDGVLVIRHDTDETGVYEGCPTVREVLALVAQRPGFGVNYDLKDANLEKLVVELHKALCPANPIYLSGTVSYETLRREDLSPAIPLLNAEEIVGQGYWDIPLDDDTARVAAAEEMIRVCHDVGVKVVNVEYHTCTDAFRETLRTAGIEVSCWTINEVEPAVAMSKKPGVFNITTRLATDVSAAVKG